MVVHRIFPHSAVKFSPIHFLIKQRKLRIEKHNMLIVKREDFVFVNAHIYRIAEMIGVMCFLLRLAFSHLRRFLFRRSSGEDFTVSLFFSKFGSAFFLFLKPLRINLFFLWIEIAIEPY